VSVVPTESSRARIVAAFAALYVIWGSTYLAIRYLIETLPAFLAAGFRFLLAGAVLYAYARTHGAGRPTLHHWRSAVLVGGLLLLGGNGAVVWASRRVPSGLVSLLISMTPLWMVAIDWARPGGARPRGPVLLGLLLGLAGLVVLIGPESLAGGERLDLPGAAVLVFGTVCWASGSIYARHAPLPHSSFLATAMEMSCGGALLVLLSVASGEPAGFDLTRVSLRSVLAFLYLTVFGSLVAFTAYIWLLSVCSTARVSTYAYVNPLIALFLGWALAGESLSRRTLAAAAVIITAVALIVAAGSQAPAAAGGLNNSSEEPAPEGISR
jgi:drug/metabolite transporter (DMT)-like permease